MFPYQVWGDDGPWFSTCRSSVSGDGLFGRGFVNAALGRCPMTRRSLVNTGLAGLATFCCCSRKFAQTTAVRDLEVGSVAVINLLDQNLIAHDLNGTKCGRLQLPECCSWSPAIAADASTVAWFPTSSFPYPQSAITNQCSYGLAFVLHGVFSAMATDYTWPSPRVLSGLRWLSLGLVLRVLV